MTPQQLQAMKLALEALKNNKLTHLYCEDTWYSCPKHEDGCANEADGDECNCGADDVNAQFDQAIIALEEALAQPEQEPVAWLDPWTQNNVTTDYDAYGKHGIPLYTTPPQRKPLSAEKVSEICAEWTDENGNTGSFGRRQIARAIEAAHGIKE